MRGGMALGVVLAGILALAMVWADQPTWADNGKSAKGKPKPAGEGPKGKGAPPQGETLDGGHTPGPRRGYFSVQHRALIQEYFAEEVHRGHCPPGLAKKGNGCRPPGQAKKWSIGRPLPREVVFHDLPPEILVELGPPPSRHRFVRVAQDILLIAVGTGMVVDAIEDLQWEFSR